MDIERIGAAQAQDVQLAVQYATFKAGSGAAKGHDSPAVSEPWNWTKRRLRSLSARMAPLRRGAMLFEALL